jgi:ABC-2 type transport system permease protein/lipopolysaccharide transport system permease protein
MWTALAMQDIKMRYRGSILGPFWLTISTLVMVVAIGGIYPRNPQYTRLGLSPLSRNRSRDLVAAFEPDRRRLQHLCQRAGRCPPGAPPFSLHAFRSVFRNLIVFAHSFVIIPFVICLFFGSGRLDRFWIIRHLQS